MKIRTEQDLSCKDLEITIKYAQKDTQVTRILDFLQSFDMQIRCNVDGTEQMIDIADIYYIESVDKKTFVYLEKEVYHIDLLFFLICIAGNIINVIMEEGLFRGFFQKMLERKHAFLLSAAIASSLFGLWHIMAPVRSYCDGTMSRSGFIANAVLLVTTSALVGFKFALMTRLTDSLYMAMGHHFTNNAIINMLHVVSGTGTDSLMTVRISIAQSISFIIVWIWYMQARRSRNV